MPPANDAINAFRNFQNTLYSTAWNELISDPDELITDLLVDKAKESSPDGYEPNREDAQRFLSTYLNQAKIELSQPPTLGEDKTNRKDRTKPTAFTFNNKRHEIKHWCEYLVKFCEILSQIRSDRFEEVLTPTFGQGTIFSRNPAGPGSYHLIPGTDIYVRTNHNSERIKCVVKILAKHFDVDKPYPLTNR